MKFNLGDTLRDRISGFEGVAVARTVWLNNCDRYTLQPRKLDSEGQPQKVATFDVSDLELVTPVEPPKPTVTTGGPRPDPTR